MYNLKKDLVTLSLLTIIKFCLYSFIYMQVNSDGDTVDILDESTGPAKKRVCRRTRAATKDAEEEEDEEEEDEEEDEEDNGPGQAKKLDR